MSLRLGIAVNDESVLKGARETDPVEVVLVRSTFLNPPRAASVKRLAQRLRARHPKAELIPYAWHYLSHEPDDGIVVGTNRSLDDTGNYGHFRDTPAVNQAWAVTKVTAEALGTRSFVVGTPPSFSPGNLSRRRMTRFVEQARAEGYSMIWESQGLWETQAAAAFGSTIDVQVYAPAFGMTGQVLELDGVGWLRVAGGKDARVRSSNAEVLAYALAERLDEDPEASLTLIFDGPRCYTNLRTFVSALEML